MLYRDHANQVFSAYDGGWRFGRDKMVLYGPGPVEVFDPRELKEVVKKHNLTPHEDPKADETVSGAVLKEIIDAIMSPKYQHSRFRDQQTGGRGITYIYHREPESPSGVQLAASGYASIVDPLLRALRNNSPLSPTEGLSRR